MKKGKLMSPNGKYKKDGVEKTNWQQVGIARKTDDGKESIAHFSWVHPAGFPHEGGLVWYQIFWDEESKNAPGADEDIPF